MPPTYWSYAFTAGIYLINRLPSTVINNGVPYEKLFTQPPNYMKLRVFGCMCFPWLRPYAAHKLDRRSLPRVFLGYSLIQSVYLCLDTLSGRIYVFRHVQFVENSFPFATVASPAPPTSSSDMISPTSHPITTTVPFPPLVTAPLPPLGSDLHHASQSPTPSPSTSSNTTPPSPTHLHHLLRKYRI